jgi:hypothetical protein
MTPMVVMEAEGILLCGKDDGTVVAFSARDGSELGALYSHNQGVSIVRVEAAIKKRFIASADNSGRILVVQLLWQDSVQSGENGRYLPAAEIFLDHRVNTVVNSLIINGEANRLLVNTRELWNLATRQLVQAPKANDLLGTKASAGTISAANSTIVAVESIAFQHPAKTCLFVVMQANKARVFKWTDFEEVTSAEGITLKRPDRVLSNSSLESVSYHVGAGMVFEHRAPHLRHCGTIVVWPSEAFNPESANAGVPNENLNLKCFEPATLAIVGISDDSTLFYIDRDLWLCSSDIRDPLLLFRPIRIITSCGKAEVPALRLVAEMELADLVLAQFVPLDPSMKTKGQPMFVDISLH